MTEKKVAVITGAGRGIGAATADLFANRGWSVAATARKVDPEHPTQFRMFVCALDVTDEDSIRHAVDQVLSRFGRIDVLVNNAGDSLCGPLEAISSAELTKQFAINVVGAMAVTRHVLPAMRSQRSGTIVNVSSIGGQLSFPFLSAYHGSKFALEGMTESLRFELQPFGIRMKLIEPGGIASDERQTERWVSHRAYQPVISRLRVLEQWLKSDLPGPEHAANAIFRAATDPSHRLRYRVKPGFWFHLHRLLPDAAWRSVIGLPVKIAAFRPAQSRNREASAAAARLDDRHEGPAQS
jgi:NAD(P)-dependent dehydrogenase (short-subunit alcohol dehydrogenase family)